MYFINKQGEDEIGEKGLHYISKAQIPLLKYIQIVFWILFRGLAQSGSQREDGQTYKQFL